MALFLINNLLHYMTEITNSVLKFIESRVRKSVFNQTSQTLTPSIFFSSFEEFSIPKLNENKYVLKYDTRQTVEKYIISKRKGRRGRRGRRDVRRGRLKSSTQKLRRQFLKPHEVKFNRYEIMNWIEFLRAKLKKNFTFHHFLYSFLRQIVSFLHLSCFQFSF
jgi:hypothetical protein